MVVMDSRGLEMEETGEGDSKRARVAIATRKNERTDEQTNDEGIPRGGEGWFFLMDGWMNGWMDEFIPVESMYFLGGGDSKGDVYWNMFERKNGGGDGGGGGGDGGGGVVVMEVEVVMEGGIKTD